MMVANRFFIKNENLAKLPTLCWSRKTAAGGITFNPSTCNFYPKEEKNT
jgi:hypothetical protein